MIFDRYLSFFERFIAVSQYNTYRDSLISIEVLLERKLESFLIYVLDDIILSIVPLIVFFLGLLLSVAYVVLLERKLLGSIQRRRGPNKVGFFGLLQPLADGIKLLCKEYIFPKKANKYLFIIVSLLTFVVSFMLLFMLQFSFWSSFVYSRYSILIILGVLSMNTLFIPLAGWTSHSRYGFLGGIRDVAQIISYELSLTCVILSLFFITKNVSIYHIVEAQMELWYCVYLLPFYLLFIIIFLAKLNRVPFDLPEGEAEIVAGFNIEYSSFIFALFFLGEYGNIFFISFLSSIFFLGGWLPYYNIEDLNYGLISLNLKVVAHVFFIIWIRGTLPRYRYDQLIKLGWKFLLPFVFGLFIVYYASEVLHDNYSWLFTFWFSVIVGYIICGEGYLCIWVFWLVPSCLIHFFVTFVVWCPYNDCCFFVMPII